MNKGQVTWSSPSNIAIVKYWGKYGNQMPRNPSVSFTLSESKSITNVHYQESVTGKLSVRFFLDGIENEKFASKTALFFEKLSNDLPWISALDFEINSKNTFPHSSGIASSASGMSALVMCLLEIGTLLGVYDKSGDERLSEASHFSRLGSGSASRSVFPLMAVWGEHELYQGSSDQYAIGIGHAINDVFKTYHNDILIISRKEKSVSSSAGHGLMDTNPYATVRYKQAYDHMSKLKSVLESGDVDTFGKIAEQEALILHALMMASDPSFILLEPDSVGVIKKIREFRNETKLPVYFTIDAGPNIHVLYPDFIKNEVSQFIQNDLEKYCTDGMIIKDRVGNGPEKLL